MLLTPVCILRNAALFHTVLVLLKITAQLCFIILDAHDINELY